MPANRRSHAEISGILEKQQIERVWVPAWNAFRYCCKICNAAFEKTEAAFPHDCTGRASKRERAGSSRENYPLEPTGAGVGAVRFVDQTYGHLGLLCGHVHMVCNIANAVHLIDW